MSPNRIACLIFDCDGVLLDTVTAKVRAFAAWVPAEHGHLREAFRAFNLSAFGRSRRVQLRYFYEDLVGRSISEDFLDREVERFAQINLATIKTAPWLPGSREFLDRAVACDIPMAVLSGTPEPELRDLMAFHGVTGLFRDIIGSPTTKVDGIGQIVERLRVERERVRFIGDATHDYESARQAGVPFIYKPSDAVFTASDEEVCTVQSLLEIAL